MYIYVYIYICIYRVARKKDPDFDLGPKKKTPGLFFWAHEFLNYRASTKSNYFRAKTYKKQVQKLFFRSVLAHPRVFFSGP